MDPSGWLENLRNDCRNERRRSAVVEVDDLSPLRRPTRIQAAVTRAASSIVPTDVAHSNLLPHFVPDKDATLESPGSTDSELRSTDQYRRASN